LPNKLALGNDIDEWVRQGRPFTFTTIRAGNLRSISDLHGAALCDLATIELASRVQLATVPGEQIYQITYHEFVHLCPGTESPDRVAAVLSAAKQPLVLKGTLFDVGIAAGIARYPEHGENADDLSMRASMAVSEAERMKTVAPVVYVPSLEAKLRSKAQLEGEVKEALAKGLFSLFLQPKASLTGLHVTGAEALIRWHHREKGWVGPADFLGVLEACGLMRELDNWVIAAAMRQIRVLSAQGVNVPVSINLSVHSLTDPDIVTRVREGLRAQDVAPCLLEIEIHEGGVMRDVEASIRVLHGLHDLGVGLSIDDFGTGYSSFAYLTRFPIQTLKIDRSFVLDMAESKASGRVVAGMVKLAHSIGLKVVAEGAESSAQIAMLRRFHCDEIQGYGYARPMPLEAFARFAQANATPRGPSAFAV
ncbi:MAG TPA: GGDEF domain-containing phosphodiesterase, partial [Burkholderiaceae bacterium]|nr:GGDEF domain-containing phosphodiesterase [Burkholderiaceae bacterium]